jgi:hypothetical protein
VFSVRWFALAAFSGVVLASLTAFSHAAVDGQALYDPRTGKDELSVMTFNVKGLPFPAAFNRTPALEEIGSRLAGLRRKGKQPNIVLLQEAFVPEAKSIASFAGYKYVEVGPQPSDVNDRPASAMPGDFRSRSSWFKGETEGKWIDSGLVVMSDYPIIRSKRMPFPADACAGYDCLAAKGVLLVWVKVPGHEAPLAIADTHLNSRGASGVAVERADSAFAHQMDAARNFVAANVSANTGIIFGGDFNVGHSKTRLADAALNGGILPGAHEAIHLISGGDPARPLEKDLEAVSTRAKDMEYFRAGDGFALRLKAVSVPFGIDDGGFDLSDHLGFVADYALN